MSSFGSQTLYLQLADKIETLIRAGTLRAGAESLRRQIARRSLDWGGHLTPDEIISTSGGTEALGLCLRAVTKPGDVVAVESPTYFGVLQAIEEHGLKALEIPMHPRTG